jgi:hypothetical protein
LRVESVTLIDRNRQDSMLLLQRALLAAEPRQRRVARKRVAWRWTLRISAFVIEGIALLVAGTAAAYLLTDSIHPSPLIALRPSTGTAARPVASGRVVELQQASSAVVPEKVQQVEPAAQPQPDMTLAEPPASARKGL